MDAEARKVSVNPEFLQADDAIETLYSALHHSPKHGLSLNESMSRLERIYRHGNEEVRYKILTELIELEYSGARSLLIEALRNDKSPLLRHEAAFGLGVLSNKSNVGVLRDAMLNDDNLMVRHEAAIALAEVGDETILAAIEQAAQDERPEVAASARYAADNIRLRLYRERSTE